MPLDFISHCFRQNNDILGIKKKSKLLVTHYPLDDPRPEVKLGLVN